MIEPPNEWKTIGKVDVDAGVIWLGDPCYVFDFDGGDRPKDIGKDWHEFCDKLEEKGEHFRGYCQFNHEHGHSGLGVCVSSGWGDGSYPVQVKKIGNRIAEVRIVFIGDEAEEDDWEDKLDQQLEAEAKEERPSPYAHLEKIAEELKAIESEMNEVSEKLGLRKGTND